MPLASCIRRYQNLYYKNHIVSRHTQQGNSTKRYAANRNNYSLTKSFAGKLIHKCAFIQYLTSISVPVAASYSNQRA